MRMPGFKMQGSGWQAVWTFIAILAAVRTLGELFRHGWSDIVLLGLLSLAAAAGFAWLARGGDAGPESLAPQRLRARPRRPADPILPGRRFF